MTLLSVLISLLLDHLLHVHRESRVACAVRCYAAQASRALPASWTDVGAVLAVVAPPAIVVALVQWALAYWFVGIVYVAVAVVVLLFSLGPLDVADLSEDYIDAARADDPERADWYYAQLTGERAPADSGEEGRHLARAVLYLAHDHLFATLFWFCVLGPAGAVLYRLSAQLAFAPAEGTGEAYQRSARFVCGALGWIPARLIAFGYALTGRFDQALSAARGRGFVNGDLVEGNRGLLGDTGTAALRAGEPAQAGSDGERRSSGKAATVGAARALAVRTGVFWLAVIAVLTLAGWLV
jgi:AmpE protein